MTMFESPEKRKEILEEMSSSSMMTGAESGAHFSNVRLIEIDLQGNMLDRYNWSFFELADTK